MDPSIENFVSYSEYKDPRFVHLANKALIPVLGIGTVSLDTRVGDTRRRTELQGVLHVPALANALLSIRTLNRRHLTVEFQPSQRCVIRSPSRQIIAESAPGTVALYELHLWLPSDAVANIAQRTLPAPSFDLLHKRLAHASHGVLKQMITKGLVKGISDVGSIPNEIHCDACIQSKMTAAPFALGHKRADTTLGRVHSDLGEFEHLSIGGCKYFGLIVDDRSAYLWVHPMKHKGEFAPWFIGMDKIFHNQHGHHVGIFRADGGGEFCNSELDSYFEEHGILKETTVPDTAAMNGVAERMVRALKEKVRAVLKDRDCPDGLWAEAILAVRYSINFTLTTSNGGITPYQAFFGIVPDISRLRVFYCDAWIHRSKKQGAKALGDRGIQVKFIGYPEDVAAYKFWNPETRKTVVSRDPLFIETALPRIEVEFNTDEIDDVSDARDDDMPDHQTKTDTENGDDILNLPPLIQSPEPQAPTPPLHRILRDRSAIKPPGRLEPADYGRFGALKKTVARNENAGSPRAQLAEELHCMIAAAHEPLGEKGDLRVDDDLGDSPSAKDALSGPEAPFWNAAISEELESIIKAEVYTLVDPAQHNIENLLGSKLVLRKKRDPDGEILRYKARLTACGDRQREGVDYVESFAPVVKSASLRVFFAHCVNLGLKIRHMDVKCAFLHGILKEAVYMRQPKGYEVEGKEGWVWKLHKALYGLKQGGREWYAVIDGFFQELGFTRAYADHCVYILRRSNTLIIIPLYVDDLLIGYNDDGEMGKIKGHLEQRFEMKDLGPVSWVLGMRVIYDLSAGRISIDQSQYVASILTKFGMLDSNPTSTPLPEGISMLPATEAEANAAQGFPYLEAIGSLMYAMMGTRPDIAYAVSILSRFASHPGPTHVSALKHLLRYLQGTRQLGITFTRDGGSLMGYTDSDWAKDIPTRKSVSGGVFMLAGGPVSWSSKAQTCVAQSSTEAEYVASAEAAKELIWLRYLLRDIHHPPSQATPLFMDNRGASLLARNPVYHNRTKHIDIRHHFIRQCVSDGSIDVKLISTSDNAADLFTKSLGRIKLQISVP